MYPFVSLASFARYRNVCEIHLGHCALSVPRVSVPPVPRSLADGHLGGFQFLAICTTQLETVLHKSLCKHMFSFLSAQYPRHMLGERLTWWEIAKQFSKNGSVLLPSCQQCTQKTRVRRLLPSAGCHLSS